MELGHSKSEACRDVQRAAEPLRGGVRVPEAKDQVTPQHCELRIGNVALATQLDRPVDRIHAFGQSACEPLGAGFDGKEERPEDRRRGESLIEREAAVGLAEAFRSAVETDGCRALEGKGKCFPYLVVVLVGYIEGAARAFVGEVEVTPPEVQQADVEEGVGRS